MIAEKASAQCWSTNKPQALQMCCCRAQVAAVRVRDVAPAGSPASGDHAEQPSVDPFSAVDCDCPSSEAAVVVKCIMLRAAFGGMAGDVDMLRDAAPAWHRRCAVQVPSRGLCLYASTAPLCAWLLTAVRSPGLLAKASRRQRGMLLRLLLKEVLAMTMSGCLTCTRCTRKQVQVPPGHHASSRAAFASASLPSLAFPTDVASIRTPLIL